jgi:hypothetical protein
MAAIIRARLHIRVNKVMVRHHMVKAQLQDNSRATVASNTARDLHQGSLLMEVVNNMALQPANTRLTHQTSSIRLPPTRAAMVDSRVVLANILRLARATVSRRNTISMATARMASTMDTVARRHRTLHMAVKASMAVAAMADLRNRAGRRVYASEAHES